MKALVLDAAGLRLDADWAEPNRRRGEAIVRVTRAGICGTDLELRGGYKGFHGVAGHEFVGVVEACATKKSLVGTRVVGEINVGCGDCLRCERGDGRHCAQREVLGLVGRDGAFAERLTLPVRNLRVVPDMVPDEHAVFVEPLAAALHVDEQVDVDEETRVVVLGPGRLGRLLAAVLGRRTRHLVLVGRRDAPPSDADLVVDATGSQDGFARALETVRPLGTIVLKSTCAGDAVISASLLTKTVVKEVTIIGSRCGSPRAFDQAILLLAARQIDVGSLVEATYRLEDFERAFEHAARPGALKVQFDFAAA